MYQKSILIGNVGRDPEMRYTPKGTAVTQFSMATNEQYTAANGEKVKRTTWWRVACWGKMGEVVNQYVRKGMLVMVEGKVVADPQTGGPRVWMKQDGTAGATFEITAATVKFLSHAAEGHGQGVVEMAEGLGGEATEMPSDENIPF